VSLVDSHIVRPFLALLEASQDAYETVHHTPIRPILCPIVLIQPKEVGGITEEEKDRYLPCLVIIRTNKKKESLKALPLNT